MPFFFVKPGAFRLLLILMIFAVNSGCRESKLLPLEEVRLLMGTTVAITVEGADPVKLKQGVNAAYEEMARLSDMMSHYDPNSVVSEINRRAGIRPVSVPPELMEVLKMARQVSMLSDGAFDITIGSLKGWRFDPETPALPAPDTINATLPLVNYRNVVLDDANNKVFLKHRGMRIDLGGIAKLYILHAGMTVLQRHGIRHAMINGGGDIEVIGGFRGRPWRVGIQDPRNDGQLLARLKLNRGFVVSSGDYERYFFKDGRRYHHILDPETGYPATAARHVTLVGTELAQINGLATAMMVKGTSWARALIERTPGLGGVIVDARGNVWISPDLKSRLQCIRPACTAAM